MLRDDDNDTTNPPTEALRLDVPAPPSQKPRPLAFYAVRALTRYLGPEIREFANAIVDGNAKPEEITPRLAAKLERIRTNVARHGRIRSMEEIESVVPTSVQVGGFQRLPDDVIRQILALRKDGHSKRSIGKTLKRPTTTIHNVLEREGDPAPADLLKKEAAAKLKTLQRLQAQMEKLNKQMGG